MKPERGLEELLRARGYWVGIEESPRGWAAGDRRQLYYGDYLANSAPHLCDIAITGKP